MKGFVGVTDNDWFACGSLLKQVWPKAQGLRLKAFRSNWAKIREWGQDCVIEYFLTNKGLRPALDPCELT